MKWTKPFPAPGSCALELHVTFDDLDEIGAAVQVFLPLDEICLVIDTVRLDPLPPKTRLLLGTRAGSLELPRKLKLPGGESASPACRC